MRRSRMLYIAADVALVASLVASVAGVWHYGLIDEQTKSLWLRRRDWLNTGLYVSLIAAALLFVAGFLVRRRESRRLTKPL